MVDLSNFDHVAPHWAIDPSNRAAGELSVHVFGPYRSEYIGILEDIVESLRDEGYSAASTCEQLPNHDQPDVTRAAGNWWESVYCMNSADAAIFFILEPDDERLNGKPKEGLNSSVIAELTFWTHFFADDSPALVIIEGDMREIGSLVPGLVDIYNLEKALVDFDDLSRMENLSLMSCNDWLHRM